ncbi:hypothetical protein ASD89_11280 [Caulobacter sp. Root656]|nr:hypothetical protein ASD89_11280 [Caulobacter sp. Root656]
MMPVKTATGALQITVQNKMLYDQRAVSSAPRPDRLHVIQLKSGEQNILTNNDFDTGFLRYYPDPASLTGWSMQTVALPGLVVASMVVGYRADGTPRLFASTPDVSGETGTIYELSVAADGALAAPVPIQSCASAASTMLFLPETPVLLWSEIDGGLHVVKGAHGDKLDQTFFPNDPISNHPVQGGDMVAIPKPPSIWPNLGFVVNTGGPQLTAVSVQSTIGASALTFLPALTNGDGKPATPTSCAMVAYPDGTVRLFATAGDGVVQTLDASEPAILGSLTWGAAWSRLDLGTTLSAGAQVRAASRADGGVTLSLLDATTGLWVAEQGGKDAPWAKAELIAPGAGLLGDAFTDDQGDFGYGYSDSSGYRHLLTRDAATTGQDLAPGDWNTQDVRIENGTTLASVSVYRLGVVVTDMGDGGAPVAGAAILLSADDEIAATVNGQNLYFSRDDTHAVTTDSDGCIWLMADIVNGLATPVFTVTSGDARFDEAVTIKPEADAQTYTTAASAEILQNAVDASGAPLLPAGSPYETISAKLAQLGASVAHIYAGQHYASPRLVVPARAGLRVVLAGQPAIERPVSAGHWSMRRENGQVAFEEHTPESAAARRQALIARVAASRGVDASAADFEPNGFFDDWEDAFDSIVDTVCDLGELIIDGLTATAHFIVDGIERIVEAAIDAASVIVDAVKAVLNFAGAVLGRMVGWLVRAIGWLLGLPDLVAIKNDIKQRVVTAVTGLTQVLPDPQTYVAPAQAQIQSWKCDIDQLIDQYRSTPAGTQSNGQYFGGIKTVISALTSGGASILPEISWGPVLRHPVAADGEDRGRWPVGRRAGAGRHEGHIRGQASRFSGRRARPLHRRPDRLLRETGQGALVRAGHRRPRPRRPQGRGDLGYRDGRERLRLRYGRRRYRQHLRQRGLLAAGHPARGPEGRHGGRGGRLVHQRPGAYRRRSEGDQRPGPRQPGRLCGVPGAVGRDGDDHLRVGQGRRVADWDSYPGAGPGLLIPAAQTASPRRPVRGALRRRLSGGDRLLSRSSSGFRYRHGFG